MLSRASTKWVLIAFALACVPTRLSAKPDDSVREVKSLFTIHASTVDDGLPQNRVSALAQTPDGYLWVGTWFGLARFDGVRFTPFNHYNTQELESDAINALAVGPDGALWIG